MPDEMAETAIREMEDIIDRLRRHEYGVQSVTWEPSTNRHGFIYTIHCYRPAVIKSWEVTRA